MIGKLDGTTGSVVVTTDGVVGLFTIGILEFIGTGGGAKGDTETIVFEDVAFTSGTALAAVAANDVAAIGDTIGATAGANN